MSGKGNRGKARQNSTFGSSDHGKKCKKNKGGGKGKKKGLGEKNHVRVATLGGIGVKIVTKKYSGHTSLSSQEGKAKWQLMAEVDQESNELSSKEAFHGVPDNYFLNGAKWRSQFGYQLLFGEIENHSFSNLENNQSNTSWSHANFANNKMSDVDVQSVQTKLADRIGKEFKGQIQQNVFLRLDINKRNFHRTFKSLSEMRNSKINLDEDDSYDVTVNHIFLPPNETGFGMRSQIRKASKPSERKRIGVRIGDVKSQQIPTLSIENIKKENIYVRQQENTTITLENGFCIDIFIGAENTGSRLCVELRSENNTQSSDLWIQFCKTAAEIALLLKKFKCEYSESESVQSMCDGDHGTCRQPNCHFYHNETVCLKNFSECPESNCQFAHRFTDVNNMLMGLGLDCLPSCEKIAKVHEKNGIEIRIAFRFGLSHHFKVLFELCEKQYASVESKIIPELDLRLRTYRSFVSAVEALPSEMSNVTELLCRLAFRLKKSLPLFAEYPSLQSWVNNQTSRCLQLEAETGAGKSTQLCQYLADIAEVNVSLRGKVIICTQPRGVAAELLAKRVRSKKEYNSHDAIVVAKGKFDWANCQKIVFVAEHLMVRYIVENSIDWKNIFAIIVDEAHERTISCDMLMGLVKQQIQHHSHLRLVVSSATLESKLFDPYLTDHTKIKVTGRPFPVSVEYRNDVIGEDEKTKIVNVIIDTVREPPTLPDGSTPKQNGNHILVFVSTPVVVEDVIELLQSQIHEYKAQESLEWDNIEVLPFSGKQSVEEQDAVFESHKKKKIIIATSIAETSLTIKGISYVIDSGLCRSYIYDSRKKASEMHIVQTSRSSANQRKGRAGRTACGVCIRLYSRSDYEAMLYGKTCQLLSAPLHRATLQLTILGHSIESFDWIEKPTTTVMDQTSKELKTLGALNEVGEITTFGEFTTKTGLEITTSRFLFEFFNPTQLCEALQPYACLVGGIINSPGILKRMKDSDKKYLAEKYSAGRWGDLLAIMQLIIHVSGTNPTEKYENNYVTHSSIKRVKHTAEKIFNEASNYGKSFKLPTEVSNSILEKLKVAITKSHILHLAVRHCDVGTMYSAMSGDAFIANTSLVKYDKQPTLPNVIAYGNKVVYENRSSLMLVTPIDYSTLEGESSEWVRSAVDSQLVKLIKKCPSIILIKQMACEVSECLKEYISSKLCSESLPEKMPTVLFDFPSSDIIIRCRKIHERYVEEYLDKFISEEKGNLKSAVFEVPLVGNIRLSLGVGGRAQEILFSKNNFISLSLRGTALRESSSKISFARKIIEKFGETNTNISISHMGPDVRITFSDRKTASQVLDRFKKHPIPDLHLEPHRESCELAQVDNTCTTKNTIHISVYLLSNDPEETHVDKVIEELIGLSQQKAQEVVNNILGLFPEEVNRFLTWNYNTKTGKVNIFATLSDDLLAQKVALKLQRLRSIGGSQQLRVFTTFKSEIPLPRQCTGKLQSYLRKLVMKHMEPEEFSCDVIYCKSQRSLTITAANQTLISKARRYLLQQSQIQTIGYRSGLIRSNNLLQKLKNRMTSNREYSQDRISYDLVYHCSVFIGTKELKKKVDLAVEEIIREIFHGEAPTTAMLTTTRRAKGEINKYVDMVKSEHPNTSTIQFRDVLEITGSKEVVNDVEKFVENCKPYSKSELPEDQCKVCLSTFEAPFSLLCGHTFCRECIVNSLGNFLSTPITAACWICNIEMAVEEVVFLTNPGTLQRMAEAQRETIIKSDNAKDDNPKLCAQKMCVGISYSSRDSPHLRSCSGCDTDYCEQCTGIGPWHEGRCKSSSELKADEIIQEIKDSLLQNRCPRCGIPFHDFEGCFALKCDSCNCGFCGYCMKDCGSDAHRHVRTCRESRTSSFKENRRIDALNRVINFLSKKDFDDEALRIINTKVNQAYMDLKGIGLGLLSLNQKQSQQESAKYVTSFDFSENKIFEERLTQTLASLEAVDPTNKYKFQILEIDPTTRDEAMTKMCSYFNCRTDSNIDFITSYTKSTYYRQLNQSLRNPMTQELYETLKPYMHYMLTALRSLQSFDVPILYRGIGVRRKVAAQYTPGSSVLWRSINSCTSEKSVAENFSDKRGEVSVIFIITAPRASQVSGLSSYGKEYEWLLAPYTRLLVGDVSVEKTQTSRNSHRISVNMKVI